MPSADFIIGYLERFAGLKEMPLTLWLDESTEEDFIPQHRIKYFKRAGTGEVVWDRDERIDKIFRSGLGDGASAPDVREHRYCTTLSSMTLNILDATDDVTLFQYY